MTLTQLACSVLFPLWGKSKSTFLSFWTKLNIHIHSSWWVFKQFCNCRTLMPIFKSLTSGKCHFWYHVDTEGPYEEAVWMDVYNLIYYLHQYSWTIHPSQYPGFSSIVKVLSMILFSVSWKISQLKTCDSPLNKLHTGTGQHIPGNFMFQRQHIHYCH